MKRLLTSFLAAALVVAGVSLAPAVSFAQSQAASACWSGNTSHPCTAAEIAAIQASAANAIAAQIAVQLKHPGQGPVIVKVAQLPVCNSTIEGYQVEVTDALTPAWHATPAGGGAVHILVDCLNGAWVVN